MKLEDRFQKIVKSMIVCLLIVCMGVLNVHVVSSAAAGDTTETSDQKNKNGTIPMAVGSVPLDSPGDVENAKDVAAEYQAAAITQKATNPGPEPTTQSGSNTMMYAGIGLAAVAGIAIAAGSGGGGSSNADPEPEPTKPPVGADLNGDNWHGRLILVESGFKEEVTATVKQNGSELEITTSSAQKYGKKFIGKIDKSAFVRVTDQDTGEDWTTHYQKARWNMIDLYDYVHMFKDLDRLYLTRESKQ